MDGTEKATYLIFGRGHDPEKLRLGNLVMFPYNPDESDPYICRYTLTDLKEWTGKAMEEPELTINRVNSNEKEASLKLAGLVGGDVNRSQGSTLKIKGKNARRFQIDQATEFLNSVILSSPEAKKWLGARITLSKTMLRLSRLKVGKSRYPHIWMVTGIQMLSDATIHSDRTGSAKTGANVHIPIPEMASAVLSALGSDSALADADASITKGVQSGVEYCHKDERVWAAQFRRLKLDFMADGAAQLETAQDVSLDCLLHLGPAGMKGGPPLIDETRHIAGVLAEDMTMDDADVMTDEERKTFEKLRSTSGKHALLFGGSEKGLRGTRRDFSAMADLFLDRGFSLSFCYGSEATRKGILEAWQLFLQRIPERSEDAAVVYYSGHGGACESKTSPEAFRAQYLLPVDIEQTTEHDFRGILDVEFSHFVNCLTNRTHNVTIIADCCHSERIARGLLTPEVRAWSPLERKVIDRHINRLRDAGLYERLNMEGNRYAIRVVAAESNKLAFEGDPLLGVANYAADSDNPKMGRLTKELVLELRAAGGTRTSWDMVLPKLRLALREPVSKLQRPAIEGPSMRVLFSLDRLDYWGQLRVKVQEDNTVTLMGGGVLAGVRVGDKYAITPSTASAPNPAAQIAVVRVTDVWPTQATADLENVREHGEVLDGAVAFPLERPRPDYSVVIQVGDAALAVDLEARIKNTGILYHIDAGNADGQSPFATITQDDNNLVLTSRRGLTFKYPMLTASANGDAANDLTFRLNKLVTADQLLTLAPEEADDKLEAHVTIEIGLVHDGHGKKFQNGAHQVVEGQTAYLVIRNDGESTVYASVFLVTSIGSIVWLSHGHPSGAELQPGHEYAPGQPSHGQQEISRRTLKGQRHVWPPLVPRQEHLSEAYVVVLTSGKADLGFWENLYRVRDRGPARELDDDYETRTAGYFDNLRFRVERVNFDLVPKINQNISKDTN